MKELMNVGMRALAILLIVVMAVTFMPGLSGEAAYAAGEETVYEDVDLPEDEVAENKAEALKRLRAEKGIEDADEEEPKELKEAPAAAEDDFDVPEARTAVRVKYSDLGRARVSSGGRKLAASKSVSPSGMTTITGPDKKGIITIKGVALPEGYEYTAIYIGDEHPNVDKSYSYVKSLSGRGAFTRTVNMKNYNVGFHTIYIGIDDTSTYEYPDYYDYVTYIPTLIYGKPGNSLNWYTTGKKYIGFYFGGNSYSHDSSCDVYMDFKQKGKKWSKKIFGPASTSSYSISKKGGLKPNKTYFVRLMYAKETRYNDKSYVFSGRKNGKVSVRRKLKTAYKKARVSKIRITNAKTICHKYKVHYANRYRYAVYSNGYRKLLSVKPLYHTYRYYYTKYKVNVYFKKKQDIAGVEIRTGGGTKVSKGNKKKYTVSYYVSGKKKGKRITVKVRNYRSAKYGGYSRWTKKTVKV